MPAKSPAQRRLMSAAEHGATFPKAAHLRQTMTPQSLRDFASTPDAAMKPPRRDTSHHLGRYLHPKKSQ